VEESASPGIDGWQAAAAPREQGKAKPEIRRNNPQESHPRLEIRPENLSTEGKPGQFAIAIGATPRHDMSGVDLPSDGLGP
jgi:hypothetical protein